MTFEKIPGHADRAKIFLPFDALSGLRAAFREKEEEADAGEGLPPFVPGEEVEGEWQVRIRPGCGQRPAAPEKAKVERKS